MAEPDVLPWLMTGDPSIQWQVMQDLQGAPAEHVEAMRQSVATSGWGARLLAAQDVDGRWAGGLYSPKWTSTTYTLLLLHWFGLPAGHPQAVTGCRRLWDGASFFDGGLTLAKSVHQPETCITSMLVLLASYFGYQDERIGPAVEWLRTQQLGDGGWNCQSVRSGSQHGSFHTSISVLDGLLQYQNTGGSIPVFAAMRRCRQFFLRHRLFRSHRTGAVVNPALLRFPFPPQWHFDVMRGLEHFRLAGAKPDQRLAEALGVIRNARHQDGTWPVYRAYPGKSWFRMEAAGPSRWSTLRALRVLNWAAADIDVEPDSARVPGSPKPRPSRHDVSRADIPSRNTGA